MKCKVCGCNMITYDVIDNVPIRCGKYTDIPGRFRGMSVCIYQCTTCFHSQIPYTLPEHWYEEYSIVETEKDDDLLQYYNQNFLNFYYPKFKKLRDLAIDNANVLDVGCSVGRMMEMLTQYFSEVEGVETSQRQIQVAKRMDSTLNIHWGYIEQINLDKEYSAFICTDLLEHIDDIEKFLKKLYSILKINGVGYLCIPNGQKIIDEARWYDILREHINYFSISSLGCALTKAGFYIESIGQTRNDWWLEAYVRKKELPQLLSICKDSSYGIFEKICTQYSRVGIWGAGIKGCMFLGQLSEELQKKVKYIFDANLAKWNKFTEGINVPIQLPNAKLINECDIIFITALEHEREIVIELRKKYHYLGKIEKLR